MSVKTKRLAIRQALSLAADDNKIVVIEDIKLKAAKTSAFVELLNKIKIDGRILIVVETKSDDLVRATANIPNVKIVQSTYVNTYDATNADYILITSQALKSISEWLGEAK